MQKHSFGQYEPNPLEEERESQVGARWRERTSGRREAMLATAPARINECALLAAVVLLALCLMMLQATGARAQGQGIFSPGDAVVTGFAGIKAPDAPIAPGADPLDMFHIDLDGPSAQILQLGATGAPAQGQIISAQTPFKLRARDAGQVFAVALDDALPPNIYVGQTSAFGLNIVGPDANGDGRPDRLKKGQPDAQWMAGQFGTDKGGGPGSIYRIDGQTGAVSLFATIPGNSGAGLGAIVFDRASRQFFVSDLDSGLIHRLDASGAAIDSFDHGTAGRAGAGLDAIADDGRRMDIKDPAFDVEEPETWGFTQAERRVRAWPCCSGGSTTPLRTRFGRSASATDGRFAGDARLEVQVAMHCSTTPSPRSRSTARAGCTWRSAGAQRGSYDYSVFAEPLQSSVLRYQRASRQTRLRRPTGCRSPSSMPSACLPTSATARAASRWAMATTKPAASAAARATGRSGRPETTCATARPTRQARRRGPARRARPAGQRRFPGAAAERAALQSYFVDYDGQFGDAEKAGHVGDVEIWQPCHSSYRLRSADARLLAGSAIGRTIGSPPSGDKPTNLRLEKKAIACWQIGGGKHRCGFSIKVTNTGPGVYHDHIQVRDTIPAGTTAIFSSPKFDACPGGPPNHTCTTLAPVHLLPWEKVTIPVRVDVPDNLAKQLDCKVRNRALILHASSPSEQNTDPSDDDDAATAHLPAHLCKDPPKDKTNLRITKTAAVVLQDRRQQDPLRLPRPRLEHGPRRLQRHNHRQRDDARRRDADLLGPRAARLELRGRQSLRLHQQSGLPQPWPECPAGRAPRHHAGAGQGDGLQGAQHGEHHARTGRQRPQHQPGRRQRRRDRQHAGRPLRSAGRKDQPEDHEASAWRASRSPATRSVAGITSGSATPAPACTTTTSSSPTRCRLARRPPSRAPSSTPAPVGRRPTPARRLRRCRSTPARACWWLRGSTCRSTSPSRWTARSATACTSPTRRSATRTPMRATSMPRCWRPFRPRSATSRNRPT